MKNENHAANMIPIGLSDSFGAISQSLIISDLMGL